MSRTSYNRWPIGLPTVSATVPGTDVRIPILAGEVATVLNAWAALWHKQVRPIRQVDSGGWTRTNDHPTSCHLSGTAVDLNWQTLPFRRRTMPQDERDTVHRMLRQFRGVVAWGGDWTDPVDEMHTEIAVPPGDSRLPRLAEDLSNGYLGVYAQEDDMPDYRKYPSLVPGSDWHGTIAEFVQQIDRKLEDLHARGVPSILDRLADLEERAARIEEGTK